MRALNPQLAICFLWLTFVACGTKEQKTKSPNSYWTNKDLPQGSVSCFMFVVPDCPLAMNYTREFMLLRDQWQDSSVFFVAVVPGDLYTNEEIQSFQKEFSFDIPLILDKDLSISTEFGASVSPEFFVFNDRKNLLYHGKMDEWVQELGSKYGGHGRNFVEEAIVAARADKRPAVAHKEAIGCTLEIQ